MTSKTFLGSSSWFLLYPMVTTYLPFFSICRQSTAVRRRWSRCSFSLFCSSTACSHLWNPINYQTIKICSHLVLFNAFVARYSSQVVRPLKMWHGIYMVLDFLDSLNPGYSNLNWEKPESTFATVWRSSVHNLAFLKWSFAIRNMIGKFKQIFGKTACLARRVEEREFKAASVCPYNWLSSLFVITT